jgi:hypothetical protein
MEKIWCKHITFFTWKAGNTKRVAWMIKDKAVPPNWKYCPICGAKRKSLI